MTRHPDSTGTGTEEPAMDRDVVLVTDTPGDRCRHLLVLDETGRRTTGCGAPAGSYTAAALWEPDRDDTCPACQASDQPGVDEDSDVLRRTLDRLADQLDAAHGLDRNEHAGGMAWCRCRLPLADCPGAVVLDNIGFAIGRRNLSDAATALNDHAELTGPS